MRSRWLASLALVAFVASAQGRSGEPRRSAGEFFIQRAGARWSYQAGKAGRASASISSFVEWKATWTMSLGKRALSGTWRVKEGAWLEHSALRGPGEVVLLPAVLKEGTRWEAPASVERGTGLKSTFEVMALDATVELPGGGTVEHCLAVLETGPDVGAPWTHYWAANIGKVAVRAGDEWLYRLTEFTGGRAGHGE